MGNYVSDSRYEQGYRKNEACNQDEALRNEICEEISRRKWQTSDRHFAFALRRICGATVEVVAEENDHDDYESGLSDRAKFVVAHLASQSRNTSVEFLDDWFDATIEDWVDSDTYDDLYYGGYRG